MDLATFLRPLYQDLDGTSRLDEVERIGRIARRIHAPSGERERKAFDLLLAFHRLDKWLEKVGNISRTALSVEDVTETELRQTAASIRRLEQPATDEERAVAAAILIDGAGVRGLAEQFTRARREGASQMDVLRSVLSDVFVPEWVPDSAREWLHARREARREVCRRLLEELSLDDQM